MALSFQSLISGSSGNCLLVWSDHARVLIDCGAPTMSGTRALFEAHLGSPAHVDAVIVSHMHGDHINYYSLRVLEEYGLKLMVHERCIDQLRGKHFNGHRFRSMPLETFSGGSFKVGDICIQPFEIPHTPGFPNCGFCVSRNGSRPKKAVFATDFHRADDVTEEFIDSDFIFVESNHDPVLLAKYFNYNSRFHMSNPGAAGLLCTAYSRSRRKPAAVMLGHLSEQRNTERHALGETRKAFQENGIEMKFRLFAAPRHAASVTIEI